MLMALSGGAKFQSYIFAWPPSLKRIGIRMVGKQHILCARLERASISDSNIPNPLLGSFYLTDKMAYKKCARLLLTFPTGAKPMHNIRKLRTKLSPWFSVTSTQAGLWKAYLVLTLIDYWAIQIKNGLDWFGWSAYRRLLDYQSSHGKMAGGCWWFISPSNYQTICLLALGV